VLKKSGKILSIVLAISMVLSLSVYAIGTDASDSSGHMKVLYQADKKLAPGEVLGRIKNGITDVPNDKIPIKTTQGINGNAAGIESKYLGETTQILKESQSTIDSSLTNDYVTTAAYSINDTTKSQEPEKTRFDANNAGVLFANSNDTKTNGLGLVNCDVGSGGNYDTTGSITMFVNVYYTQTVHGSGYLAKITNIETYFDYDDNSVVVNSFILYEASCSVFWDNSYNNMGMHDYASNPRELAYKNSPYAQTIYGLSSCTYVNSLLDWWATFAGEGGAAGYVGGRATYFMHRTQTPSSVWSSYIIVEVYNMSVVVGP